MPASPELHIKRSLDHQRLAPGSTINHLLHCCRVEGAGLLFSPPSPYGLVRPLSRRVSRLQVDGCAATYVDPESGRQRWDRLRLYPLIMFRGWLLENKKKAGKKQKDPRQLPPASCLRGRICFRRCTPLIMDITTNGRFTAKDDAQISFGSAVHIWSPQVSYRTVVVYTCTYIRT